MRGKYKNEEKSAVEKLTDDLGIKRIGFTCSKCGASLILDVEHMQNYCQFCSAPLPKAEELYKLSYEYMEKNKDRQLETGRMEHQEKMHTKMSGNNKVIIAVLIFFAMLWTPIMVLIFKTIH